MGGLISEIQHGCLDENIPIESLLRRVKLAAAKLDLGQLEGWVDCELNGYMIAPIPEYRKLRGDPLGFWRSGGWDLVTVENARHLKILSTAQINKSIGSLQHIISRKEKEFYDFSFLGDPQEIVDGINTDLVQKISRIATRVSHSEIIEILESVRNKVLDWSTEMERNSIAGKDYTFDKKERESAKSVTFNIGSIGKFSGNMGEGNISGDITLTDANLDEIREKMKQILKVAPQLLKAGVENSLPNDIDAVITETKKEKPDRNRIQSLLRSIHTALAGVAENTITAEAIALINSILGGN